MPKKSNIASEPILSSGAQPARARKHAPAKRQATPVVETSSSIDTPTSAAAHAATKSSHVVVTEAPAFNEVAQLAYSYWEARGYQGGSPEEDWLRAEQELRSQLVVSAT
jgi:hypothetical protein